MAKETTTLNEVTTLADEITTEQLTSVAEESTAAESATVVEESTASAEVQYKFAVTPENFVDALPIMGTGMIGIFIVMGVIIACVALLNKATSPDRKAKKLEKKKAKEAEKANKQNSLK